MSAFFFKKSLFFGNSVRVLSEIFSSDFSFNKTKGYDYWKYKFYRLCARNPASRLLKNGYKFKKCQWRHNFYMTSSSNFLPLFCLSSVVTNPSSMSISSLILELWQFPFIRKSEILPSEFRPISGDWGELGKPNLTWTSLMKCFWMLQNAGVIGFIVAILLGENQQGE